MPNTRTHSVSLYRLYAPYYVRKGGEETDGQYGKPFFFFFPSMPGAAAMRQNKPETELDTHNTRVVGPTTQETALECRYGCTKRTIRLEKYSVETHGEKKKEKSKMASTISDPVLYKVFTNWTKQRMPKLIHHLVG